MKITEIRTFVVGHGNRNYLFVKVCTDEGIHGIGEPFSCGPDEGTAKVVEDFAEWLKGRDPRDIEGLYNLMYLGSRMPWGWVQHAALSGIEHALWDIAGKAANLPVYRLIGGKCRDWVRVYLHAGGDTPQELAEHAMSLVEKYHATALKVFPFPPGWQDLSLTSLAKATEARMAALRKAVGDDVEIALDVHATLFQVSEAIDICNMLKPFRPLFVEEPLRPESYEAYAKLAAHVDVPIATGEMLRGKSEFAKLVGLGAVDIVQPDICLAGGLWEQKKIAAIAEAGAVRVAPHNPMGPVANAVNLHFAASTHNFLILEYHPDDRPPRRDLVDEPMKLVNGYLELPDRPGLGLDLNEQALAKYPAVRWHRGFLWRADGSQSFI